MRKGSYEGKRKTDFRLSLLPAGHIPKRRNTHLEFSNRFDQRKDVGLARGEEHGKFAWLRLAADLFNGRHRPGESVKLREIAVKYQLDEAYVLKVFTEFQTLGMITLTGNVSAVFNSSNP